LWGLVKKVVFADFFAQYVDVVFNNVLGHAGLCFVLATLLYTFQIYCDFSGYSDMAIGIARMLGFELTTNFKSPYFAASIKEFWSRWHISLSTWFRDYVYIPIGGNRVSKFRTSLNLMITFLISGLWHGASWTFVLWGGIHGAVQVLERVIKERLGLRIKKVLSTIVTFCVVSFAWMFFRVNSISEAFYIVKNTFADLSFTSALLQMTLDYQVLLVLVLEILCVMLFDYFNQKQDVLVLFGKFPMVLRFSVYIVAAVAVVAWCMHGDAAQQFIYFNF
jgi:D-alanyl-lipoteichoic acid acyltransferase DltB (MBOAT superfamily)